MKTNTTNTAPVPTRSNDTSNIILAPHHTQDATVTAKRKNTLHADLVAVKTHQPRFHLSPPQPVDRQSIHNSELWHGRSKIQEVIAGLCITNFFGARNMASVQSAKISHIVVCADELPQAHPAHFKYLKLDGFTDNTTTNLDTHINKTLPWIKKAIDDGGRVLVHCAAGSSRSGAIIVAYLMWELKIPMQQALEMAQQRRPIISPNPGFCEQLQAFLFA